MKRDAYPLELHLPDGTRARVRIIHTVEVNERGDATLTQLAQYPPEYERRDGTTVPLDVTIPDDLAAMGWYWSGSFLFQPWPGGDGPGVGISVGTFGLPGTFDAARRLDARRVEIQTALKARPPKKTKKAKAVRVVSTAPEPEQMELAL